MKKKQASFYLIQAAILQDFLLHATEPNLDTMPQQFLNYTELSWIVNAIQKEKQTQNDMKRFERNEKIQVYVTILKVFKPKIKIQTGEDMISTRKKNSDRKIPAKKIKVYHCQYVANTCSNKNEPC